MYVGFHVYSVQFCQFLTKLGHGRQILAKSPNIKFYENPSVGTDLFLADRQTDRQTQTGYREGMMKMQCAFRIVLRSCLRHVHVAPIRTYHVTLPVMSIIGDVSYMIKQTMTGGVELRWIRSSLLASIYFKFTRQNRM
jgi:hypothetical protein